MRNGGSALSYCLSVFLSFCLSVFLIFCLFVLLSFCLSVLLFICLSILVHVSSSEVALVLLESFCAFLDGEQKVDSIGLDGWLS